MPNLLVLCMIVFTCLFPLTIYCLILAYVNHRPRPTMVPGAWDFVGVLLGLSGFILVGGPLLVAAVDDLFRQFWFQGNWADLRTRLSDSNLWLGIWGVYFVLLIVAVRWQLTGRQAWTAIYNIEPRKTKEIVYEALKQQGHEVQMHPTGLRVRSASHRPDHPFGLPAIAAGGESSWVEVDETHASHHALLHWNEIPRQQRQAVENTLDQLLGKVASADNPVTGWLLTAVGAFLIIMLFCVLFILLVLFGG